ncbi:ABC transporter substrate-binding protein [Paeniglutamicibacter psychrophenolicus]
MKKQSKAGVIVKTSAIALAALLSLTACGGGGEAKGSSANSTLLIGTTSDVANFAPLNTVSITDMWVMNQMYPELFRAETDGSIRPLAAKSATISPDGKSIKVVLNEKFTWSDGEKLTANDLKFTLDRYVKDKLLQGKTIRENYESSKVVSPTELTVTMKSPSYGWAKDFMTSVRILPEHVFKDVPDLTKYALDAHEDAWVGAGPFTLAGVSKGQRYKFTRNEQYPLSAPGNEEITALEFRVYQDINTMQLALQSGELDLAAPSLPASAVASLESKPGIKVSEVSESVSLSKLTFNQQSKTLQSPKVRKAISGLIDTEAILETVLQGRGTHLESPVLPLFKGYAPEGQSIQKVSADQARDVFKQEGFKDADNDGFFDGLDYKILCDQGNSNHVKSAQVVRDNLATAGIKSTVACSERSTSLTAAKAADFDLYVHKMPQSYSPGTNLRFQFESPNDYGLNYTYGGDAELDELIKKSTNATDEKSYQEATQAVATRVGEQAMMLPLYIESLNYVSSTKRFDGYVQSPTEINGPVDSFSLSQVTRTK